MKTSLMLALCGIGICGCAAPPQEDMDHGPRQSVNASKAIDDYRTALELRQQTQSHQSATDRHIAALEEQVEHLRLALALLPNAQPNKPSNAVTVMAPAKSGAQSGMELAAGESIELRQHSILFRIPSPFAQAQFTPSQGMRTWLLRATAHGGDVTVHGRTDATIADKANIAIAQQRAQAAREFLLQQGVPTGSIHCDFLGAGGFHVDNSTAAGQARNRRVEIEVNRIAPEAYREIAAAMQGEDHE